MTKLKRLFRHLFSGPWQVRRYFSKQALFNIEAAIRQSESAHTGEIRFAVEADLDIQLVLANITARQRAIDQFSRLRIWDTEANNGVLIYLLLADRQVEIVADRGIHQLVTDAGWEDICHSMEAEFRRNQFEAGVLLGINRISEILRTQFPSNGSNPNELSDTPVVL